jgi:xanthine dehydrogenase accessory factor
MSDTTQNKTEITLHILTRKSIIFFVPFDILLSKTKAQFMLELLPFIDSLLANGHRFAQATVIKTWGSAPRPIGSIMVIGEDGTMSGSVSGGCVEGAIVKQAQEVLKAMQPKLLSFGVSDDEAWSVGLSCGGSIQVFLEPFIAFTDAETWKILRGLLQENKGCVLATQLNETKNNTLLIMPNGDIIGKNKIESIKSPTLKAYNERNTQSFESETGEKWFLNIMPPKHKLIIIGAAHITVDLVHLSHYFGFETIVIDPRGIFASKTDFPTPPHVLHIDWPIEILPNLTLDAYTYTVLLTHDPKIDDQALHILLKSEIAYIGCLGSKKTHEKRVKRLTDAGFTETEIEKIHAPIGVDIHAKSAREIALSIISELIKNKNAFL